MKVGGRQYENGTQACRAHQGQHRIRDKLQNLQTVASFGDALSCIERFASVAGRENVIAGTDCGFATARAGDEMHPDVAWAKLKALSEGAEIATRRLWN